MIIKKNGKYVWGFNLSYSAYSNYKDSELMFYYAKIVWAKATDKVFGCYGDGGQVVHILSEIYIKENINNQEQQNLFIKKWEGYNLDNEKGFGDKILNRQEYWNCFLVAKEIIKTKMSGKIVTEEPFLFTSDEYSNLTIKGFIDVVEYREDGVYLSDWKTNGKGSQNYKYHYLQRLFYSWAFWKTKGIIPKKCTWYYLKGNVEFSDSFTLVDVIKFDKEIKMFIEGLKQKANIIDNYKVGNYGSPFNIHKKLCRAEEYRRQNASSLNILRKDNKMYFCHGIPEDLARRTDNVFKYLIKDFFYNSAVGPGKWDGVIHFLKKDRHGIYSLPFAFYNLFKELVIKYNEVSGSNLEINMTDARHDGIVDAKFGTIFAETPYKLRPYQEEAVETMLEKKHMILYGGTGFGKSFTSAEFIKRINQRTLYVINRVELVNQTIESFEDYLGVPVGKILEGEMDINKQIVVASIQSIHAILNRGNAETKQLKNFLFNVNTLLYDECHIIGKSKTYKELADQIVNATYVIGMSGSPKRTDTQDELEMNSLLGFIEFTKTTKELIEEGYLVPMKTYFIPIHARDSQTQFTNWHEMYDYCVVNHEERNKLIADTVDIARKTKKMIVVVNRIKHGEILQKMIPKSFFINGTTKKKIRKEMYEKFKKEGGFVLISMVQIVSTGLDVPDLDLIINCAVYKSENLSAQTIGRPMRNSEGKKFGYFIDFLDQQDDFISFSNKRIKSLKKYGHNSKIKKLEEINFE